MKCPKCGTTNGKTNKFCRECGERLEGLVDTADQQPNGSVCAPHDIAPGEELFDVWQLYSAGDLDAAQGKTERLIACNPDSAAAHSILGLIYERKAEIEPTTNNSGRREALLKLAISQYERIIDLNPDSVADRQKLELLRLKLAGQQARPSAATPAPGSWFAAIPRPWLAAAGAFVVCLLIGIIVLAGGGGDSRTSGTAAQSGEETARVQTLSTPGATEEPAAPQTGASPVYTVPQAAPQAPPLPTVAPPAQLRPRPQVEPAKLPPLGELGVKVVPESKPATTIARKPETAAPRPTTDTGKETIVIPAVRPNPPADSGPQAPDGSSTLARAIDLHNQGRTQEAITAAQQAIDLYQAEVNAGRNAALARRGMENARKMISIWQQ